jgi:hypothetical protein
MKVETASPAKGSDIPPTAVNKFLCKLGGDLKSPVGWKYMPLGNPF